MKLQHLFICALCVFIIEISATRRYVDDDDDSSDDEEYNQMKRFFFRKTSTHTPSSSNSVLDNLVRPSTFPPNKWTPSTTYSPWNPSSGACSSKPCQNNGICYPTGQNTYECKCVGPWRGIYCGIADACYRSPCQNGGSCLNVVDDFWCKCPTDYYGKYCENRFTGSSGSTNNCRPNICNSGKCIPYKTTYYCQCYGDTYGEFCEKRLPKRNVLDEDSLLKYLNNVKREYLTDDSSDSSENNGDQ